MLLKISPRELTGDGNVGLTGDVGLTGEYNLENVGLTGECKSVSWSSIHFKPRESTDEYIWDSVGLTGECNVGLTGVHK